MERNTELGRGRVEAWTDTNVGRGCQSIPGAAAPGRGQARPAIRQRRESTGSALILVLVCLVMMVLLGTAYVQVARVDRRATRQLTGVNNLESIRSAIIAYMSKILKEDMMDASGAFFTAADFDEFYDYPFSNYDTGITYPVKRVSPDEPSQTGTTIGNAVGGKFDDTWLASTYIDMESRDYPSWNHLSNLNGVYLRFPKNAGGKIQEIATIVSTYNVADPTPLSCDGLGEVYITGNGTIVPGVLEYDYPPYAATWPNSSPTTPPTNGTQSWAIDYENSNWHPHGVDADGDGILDSRWTWAPEEVRQIGGTSYVVAYRIVDLSSMLNINVATGATGDGTAVPSTAESPRGYFPTEIDFTRLFSRAHNASATWSGDANGIASSIMKQRTMHGSPLPTPPGIAQLPTVDGLAVWGSVVPTKAEAWLRDDLGARVWARTNRFTEDTEKELRARGGLATDYTCEVENTSPILFRQARTATQEDKWFNVPSSPAMSWPASARGMHRYMSGHEYSLNELQTNDTRLFPELRHLVTTMSATAVHADQYTGVGVTSQGRLQYDLVYRRERIGSEAAANEIALRMTAILSIASPMYLGLTGGDVTTIREISSHFAANIIDYSDPDHLPTKVNSPDAPSRNLFGLERMPFLREAYIQAGYESDVTGMDAATMMTPVWKEWKLIPDTASYVIEIGNPFDKTCSLYGGSLGVKIRVRVLQGGMDQVGTQNVGYDVPAGTVYNMPPRDADGPEEQMVLYASGATPVTEDGVAHNDVSTSLKLTDAGFYQANQLHNINIPLPTTAINGQPIEIHLLVKTAESIGGPNDDGFITYDRLKHAGFNLPVKYNDAAAEHGDGVAKVQAHGQAAMMRDGRKIRYISNVGVNSRTQPPNLAASSFSQNNSGSAKVSTFAMDDKGIPGDTNIDKMQLAHANHQIFNVAELGYIFMYGFVEEADGDFPSRFSGINGEKPIKLIGTGGTATELNCEARHFLSMTDPAGTVVIPANNIKLPHMCMVLDQFTTISPRWDGEDNDLINSHDDSEYEQVVPGRFNVNTTPAWLLAMTSPIPEPMADVQAFYQAICEYRDRPVTRKDQIGFTNTAFRNDHESEKGIRSIGELMLIKRRISTTAANQSTTRYADGAAFGDVALRHYPHPDTAAADAPIYTDEYAAQERMARFQYLATTLTTRSDTFCAYVVVRGYDSTNFATAPLETDRFFVILDRSGVVDLNSPVVATPKSGQKN